MTTKRKKRIAIFASGAGSNAEKIIKHFQNNPGIEVAAIVCNQPAAGVVNIAQKNKIPVIQISRKEFMETGYTGTLQALGISLIVLAGFLWKVPEILIRQFPGRIINIHPALLPHYGGKGMYGMNVHTAVVNAKEQCSGITIHFVDEEYDRGNIIFQQKIELDSGETPESLAQKIHVLEHTYFPKIIEDVLSRLPE